MYPLLNSIVLQQAVDFKEIGMVIVYDGDEATPLPEEDWHQFYPFDIQFVHAPHGGVSAARNHALDAATADYVMFCDADDMFFHMCGISILIKEMDREEFDSMTTLFIEETKHPDTRLPVYIQHPNDSTFVHGKVHRRQYLIDNGIRWNENLKIHEDSYFNVLCRCVGKDPNRLKYLPTAIYLWRWRDKSICREDADYMQKTYTQLLDSSDALVDELVRRGLSDKATFYFLGMVFDTYYTLQKPKWLHPNYYNYRKTAEKRFQAYFRKHKDLWDASTPQQQMEMSNSTRTRQISEGMQMEQMTFKQWIKHVEGMK